MRLLYWLPQFHPYIGGVEVLASHFLPALVERGHEPVVVTSHGALDLPDDDEWQGVPVHRRPFTASLARGRADEVADLVADVAALKRRVAPDVVHVNVTDASPFFHLRTRAAHPCPSVVSLRVTVGGGGPASLLADLLASADAVTAVSEAALAAAVDVTPSTEPRARAILNALPDPGVADGPPAGGPVLVGAGRLVGDKGFDLAIRAMPAVRAAHPGAVLRIAGDGPERADLEGLARELGVIDAVELLGWVDPERLPAVLAEATVVVVPSRWEEAFGLVALQAAQVARPVVATRVGGLPEVVDHGTTGTLVPVDDVDALAGALLELLAEPDRAARMGGAARARARRVFTFERYVDEHLALYEELRDR
ncbi:MAG TPA: glycosyltransferase family 4 protein [Acidimicrobiales bacterium]|nr:glycosyltransferase family 4 protein [Acidimicrobiales bacterium]